MEQTPYQAANRCLPLVIANQAGWVLTCPLRFKAVWNGKKTRDAIQIEFPENAEQGREQIMSIFGSGIISFGIPWLFRTSPGLGLIVRGPVTT